MPVAVTNHSQSVQALLLTRNAVIAEGAILVNVGSQSYVRVLYPPAQVRLLQLHIAALPAADQLNLLNDAWALGQSGYTSASDLLGYINHLPSSADPIVWTRAIDLLVTIDRAYGATAERAAFRRFALTLIKPIGLGSAV